MSQNSASIEAERNLLGQILLEPSLWYELGIDAEHFSTTENRRTYEAIRQCVANGVVPDIATAYDHGADAAYVSGLTTGVGSAANWKYYEGIVLDSFRRRQVKTLSNVLSDVDTVENAVAAVYEALDAILSTGSSDKIHDRAELITPVMEQIEERYHAKGALPGISTGYERLDNCILGWQPRRLYYVGARPSQGKSALLLNMADHLAITVHTTVGFISIESSKEELLLRTFSARGSIPSQQLSTGMMAAESFDKLMSVAGDVYSSKFYIYDVPNQELAKIQAIARQMVEFHGCKVLFVDYLQKIRVQSKEERRDRVAQASTALKDMSRQLDVPIIAAAQLRRDVDNRTPTLGDFSDSSEIEKDADVAILLHPDEDGETVWAIVAKNRDGSKERVKLRFNKAYVRFEEAMYE